MTLNKSFERYLKQIVKEAVTSAQRTSTPLSNGDKLSGSNGGGLPTDEEERFWKIKDTPTTEDVDEIYHYTFDGMAETHVEDLMESLNGQLDNLLLFSALFSGINSAFIVFSLPNLNNPFQGMDRLIDVMIGSGNNGTAAYLAQKVIDSQSPSPTLNVAVNVLFASSLICSLLTAFFVVVGKQWLSYLAEEPSHPSDSCENTRRTKMQNKVVGIQRYRLRALLDAWLTTTMQIALFLFITGLILFLYTFNHVVSWFVIGFAGAGLLAYFVSTALALRDPACPFQTPVTRTILPGLFCFSFNAAYSLWSLKEIIKFASSSSSPPKAAQGQESDPNPNQQEKCGDSSGIQRDNNDAFEIQWDRRDTLRGKIADSLQLKREGRRANVEAACWMIHMTEGEMPTRIAALALLNQTRRDDIALVATYENTSRRLRGVISITDEGMKEQANISADITERTWKKLCFYIQVISHIFAGCFLMDATQCQIMDWIYEYQKSRGRARPDWDPAQMAAVIKLLLLHLDGKHYTAMAPERRENYQCRLYQTPFEAPCSSKALSLVAFAMKALPSIASKDRDQATDQQLYNDLWNSYVENDPDVIRRNLVGAIVTYANLMQSKDAQKVLPSARQLKELWECITTRQYTGACLSAGKARVEIIDASEQASPTVPADQPSLPRSDPSQDHDAIQPQKPEEHHTAGPNVLAEWKAEDKASLAEACLTLATKCNAGLPVDGGSKKDEVCQFVRDIWKTCYEDVLSCADKTPSLVETVHHLRMATALLRALGSELPNSPLVSIGEEQCGRLSSFGLLWIEDAAAKDMKDWELAEDWIDREAQAGDAITYFRKRSAVGNPPESDEGLGVKNWLLSRCPSSDDGETRPVQGLGEVVSNGGGGWEDMV